EALEAQWAESLRRLRTGRVELLAVHNLRNLAEALPFARELKEQGLVRYVGLTHYQASAHAELLQAMQDERPDFIQINYAVNAPSAASRLFPAARDLGVAVMVNRAFDDGRLFARVGGRGRGDLVGADVPEVRGQPSRGDRGDPGHRQAGAAGRPAQRRPRRTAHAGAAGRAHRDVQLSRGHRHGGALAAPRVRRG